VITGFRVAPGGAQQLYGVRPDLTCLGKIIGGGLPVGAFGGKREIMERLAPLGPVYQAGTLSGNPLALAMGYETVRILREEDLYPRLERISALLEEGLRRILGELGLGYRLNRVGSMLSLFFTAREVGDADAAMSSDQEAFRAFFHGMLAQGIYLAPSPFEASFLSAAHDEADVERTLEAARSALTPRR
jgi:glutamate-1-semialdehyde 2,1-aminomutase